MNRRHFLSSTFLSGAGLAGLVMAAVGRQPVRALTLQSCEGDNSPACNELARHNDLLAQLRAALDQKGLTPEQKQAAMAAAACPVCGQPLLG